MNGSEGVTVDKPKRVLKCIDCKINPGEMMDCPYESDVNNTSVRVRLCEECADLRGQEI